MSGAKAFDGKAFIEQARNYKPLANDNNIEAIREFERRISKNRFRHPNVPLRPLFLHHTVTGADIYAKQATFTWGGAHKERVALTAAHIVVDIKIWPLTVPAGLIVMPMCEFPGCCKFSHLGLFTLSEVRAWVTMNKEQKARRAYLRAQWAMTQAHEAERSKPGSYHARELATIAIAEETKYQELQQKYEDMNAKQLVGVTASNFLQEQIAWLAVDRLRELYNNSSVALERKHQHAGHNSTYDSVCREMMKADEEYLLKQDQEQKAKPTN